MCDFSLISPEVRALLALAVRLCVAAVPVPGAAGSVGGGVALRGVAVGEGEVPAAATVLTDDGVLV